MLTLEMLADFQISNITRPWQPIGCAVSESQISTTSYIHRSLFLVQKYSLLAFVVYQLTLWSAFRMVLQRVDAINANRQYPLPKPHDRNVEGMHWMSLKG